MGIKEKRDAGDKESLWVSCIIWLNEMERIASFHHVEGYQMRKFNSHDYYLQFLNGLIESGYRFQ